MSESGRRVFAGICGDCQRHRVSTEAFRGKERVSNGCSCRLEKGFFMSGSDAFVWTKI